MSNRILALAGLALLGTVPLILLFLYLDDHFGETAVVGLLAILGTAVLLTLWRAIDVVGTRATLQSTAVMHDATMRSQSAFAVQNGQVGAAPYEMLGGALLLARQELRAQQQGTQRAATPNDFFQPTDFPALPATSAPLFALSSGRAPQTVTTDLDALANAWGIPPAGGDWK